MRAVFGLVLIVGVALAGGAVMMAKNYITAYQNELARERAAREAIVPTIEVVVANRSLRYGEIIVEEDVRIVRWPQTAMPEGAFNAMEHLFTNDGRARYVLRAMEKDEAVLALKVTEPGEDAGITSRLERGMRAFAIKVDVATGVSGFLRPGDRVDVYWTGSRRGEVEGRSGEITKLIGTNIQLIAIDQTAGEDIDGTVIARTVTVAAEPQQVGALAQAQNTGRLSLALVGAGDDTVATAMDVDQRILLGIEEDTAPVKEEEKVCSIRTRRGAEVVNIEIPCTN
ncbi:MAG: Flp pilus assembly protein CpaB [Pseudomonadota bacterium]